MERPLYTQLLTESERLQAMAMGAGFAGSEKKAADVKVGPVGIGGVGKGLLVLSLLAGVPIGAAAHAVGRAAKRRSAEEIELAERTRLYRGAADDMERRLQLGR